jgi:error-prone DNA polymerase
MAAWRRPGVIDKFREKLMLGMRERGLTEHFAEQVFRQIRGFGEYGFPESHAASFALLVYASAYLKCHYPAEFYASILNSQPMGFYAPAQLISCAVQKSVQVLPADVNQSDWDCTVVPDRTPTGRKKETAGALRMGLRMVRGLGEQVGASIVKERTGHGLFRSVDDLTKRVRLDRGSLDLLASADAFRELTGDRRAALWDALARHDKEPALPLFGEDSARNDTVQRPDGLPQLTELEEVYADYGSTGLSLRKHPMAFCRPELERLGIAPAATLAKTPHGQIVRVAGLVIMRQRPSTAKGITFVTLEDETGSMNLILYQQIWTEYYAVAKTCSAWLATGKLENREGVIHVLVSSLQDLTQHTRGLETRSRDFR